LAAAAHPARLEALVVSDVVRDDLSAIGSGMTVADASNTRDALEVLRRYGLAAPSALTETPKPNDPVFERVTNRVILSNHTALQAARRVLEGHGWRVAHLDDAVTGDSRLAARQQVTLAKEPGTAVLSGGETTVRVGDARVRKIGRGGRNLEFALQLVIENAGLYALSADSDGIDGSSFAAGAIVTPDSLSRADKLQLEPLEFQRRNDAHGFFAALGDLVVTGATGTNVNDLRVILKP